MAYGCVHSSAYYTSQYQLRPLWHGINMPIHFAHPTFSASAKPIFKMDCANCMVTVEILKLVLSAWFSRKFGMGTCDPLSFKGIPYNWRDVKFRMPSLWHRKIFYCYVTAWQHFSARTTGRSSFWRFFFCWVHAIVFRFAKPTLYVTQHLEDGDLSTSYLGCVRCFVPHVSDLLGPARVCVY